MSSASAFAANTVIRSLFAAAFPLFTVQMFTKVRQSPTRVCQLGDLSMQMGVNWAATLLGLVGLLLSPSPFLFYKYGSRIRSGSKFAPCIVS